ncbi:DUF6597 domain-containing transcriptional factor [Carboxylicivirga taeanensis]|uniref:DUF6597 domain-containing transcriptional factor n=1 Tax=Carboxylicivirga taeanensis TaxID=1416875 RepID=UPI003F6DE6EF
MKANEITYREFEPDERLKDFIKCYWYFSIRTKCLKPFDILPDGYFDLLIVMRGNQIVDTLLTGIWSKSISISYTENTEVFGIRFKPIAIGGLFQFSIKDTIDHYQHMTLKDLGVNEQMVVDGLNGFPEYLVHYLNQQLLRLIPDNNIDKRLKKCFELVEASGGNKPVDAIAQTIGLSARQLHRLVSRMLGMGIKDYSKIVRFKKCLHMVKSNQTDYVHYYDQSHFIREIKHFTGLTPAQLNLKQNDRFIQYYDFDRL